MLCPTRSRDANTLRRKPELINEPSTVSVGRQEERSMKKTFGIIVASAFAIAAISAPVAAAPPSEAPNENAAFGFVHKGINTANGLAGVANVGEAVQLFDRDSDLGTEYGFRGQGKNAFAGK
jgi:uncharacterized membrane protein